MFDWLNARASVGLGFKAPTFQQLYLDFTNPQVGYSVFGSATVKEAFERLQQTGQIEAVLVDPSLLEKIRPENSLAYHTGMELSPTGRVTLRVNAFRNDLKDMIEAAPIAAKTNGQALYTYFNIHRVFTQGLDAEIVIRLSSALSVSATYQYLEAKDQDVLENVRAEKVFKIGGSGRTRAVQESEYGGLFNRSAHSGTIKVAYDDNHTGLTVSLRGIFRSKYGFADNNGNSILDDDSEYAPGYSLWNVTCSKRIFDFLILQAGVNNVFDVTSKEFAPSVPGRILYAGIATSFR
jgi:outer membrane receptor for ferrienterochelin and colicins